MEVRAVSKVFLATCLLFTTLGFYAHKEQNPEELGLFRAHLDDAELLELTVDQLKEALRLGRMDLFRRVLSDDFTGMKLNQQMLAVQAEKAQPESRPGIKMQTSFLEPEDDAATVSGVFQTDGMEKSVQLTFKKHAQQWKLVAADGLFEALATGRPGSQTIDDSEADFELYREGTSATQTLVRVAMSDEHGLDKLNGAVTRAKLSRQLFKQPYAGVLFSSVTQFNSAPYFSARYVQLVTDPGWNRIVYGDYDGWVKAYQGETDLQKLNRPHGIDRDARGKIYVADTGNNRIVVLKLAGNGQKTQLEFDFAFGSELLSHPYGVAWDDGGTPFDNSDDFVWVTDTGNDRIIAFSLLDNTANVSQFYGEQGSEPGAFHEPNAVAVSRFNGAADGFLYIVDSGNRRIAKLASRGDKIEWVDHYSHKRETTFRSLSVDHWGNLYAADRSYREILKLGADLQPLAIIAGNDKTIIDPSNFQVVFGSVYIEAEDQNYWAGYDQGFSIEKWSDESGAERYQLGMDLENFAVSLSSDLDNLGVTAKLTDHGKLALIVVNASGQTIRQLPAGWVVPGQKEMTWDRRDQGGFQVQPGYYRMQLTAASSYRSKNVIKESPNLYLPLYYHNDSGSDMQNDPHLVQGVRSTKWGTEPDQSIASHPSEVVYRFTDLNPAAEYEIKADFYNEGGYLKQHITVDNFPVMGEFELPVGLKQVTWMTLPRDSYEDGEIEVRFTKVAGELDAMISELWLREANFDPANPPVLTETGSGIPEAYSLSQNYPNPFNPSTTIEFAVPENATQVELRIFNTLGQTVNVLVNESLQPGNHSILWNGRDQAQQQVSSGVYFYQLSAGEFKQVRKLILMK